MAYSKAPVQTRGPDPWIQVSTRWTWWDPASPASKGLRLDAQNRLVIKTSSADKLWVWVRNCDSENKREELWGKILGISLSPTLSYTHAHPHEHVCLYMHTYVHPHTCEHMCEHTNIHHLLNSISEERSL